MEDVLERYSLHEHPLIYNDDQQEAWCCSACGLPLLSSPSYRCNNDDCNFFLHEACKQLPQELKIMSGKRREIIVDALCAPCRLEIKSRHDSHHEHELVVMRKEARLICDACGEEHKGLFFSCKLCDFYIYKDCAVLPRVIDSGVHDHLLVFSYSAFGAVFPAHAKAYDYCKICGQPFSRAAAYYCRLCSVVIHLKCAIFLAKDSVYQPVQLPLKDGAAKSSFICAMLNKKGIEKNKEDDKLSIEEYHEHPLIFHEKINTNDDHKDYSSSLCNACIQPVVNSHPFYRCRKPECDFLLHKDCADLPSQINLELMSFSHKSSPGFKQIANVPLSIFECYFCGHNCSGFRYEFNIDEHYEPYKSSLTHQGIADVECASIPRMIKHRLHHREHLLSLIPDVKLSSACCSGTKDFKSPIVYRCISCEFQIHIMCAFLPEKINHKFDKHPLQLSKGYVGLVSDSEHCFCEICEDCIDTHYWFYHCMTCDQFFHIKCIPSVGLLSKIKFGVALEIPCHLPGHPVTFTRMLNIGDQRCGECKESIQGFTDEGAFKCSKCCCWFHFKCAFPRFEI
ncbi:hypothetical protein CDL12_00841 [Handroanthus impetiginosus]|uniref:DC1 domain-containing protein n=1 Tax=Handroanthus impetiginosus TaxID=429701 RepID=A0A2G9I9H5_9LAMI|nr:hypothetical protein CDL12_00841 [Handroanthus impetiginosus]